VVGAGGICGVVDMTVSTQSTLQASAHSGGCQVLGLSPGPLPHHEEDREPPFSPEEVLEFCKVNIWAFAFPPLMGGIMSEWWV